MTLQENMMLAWRDRYRVAADDIASAVPALVKPEWIDERYRDLSRALYFAGVWS